MREKKIQTLMAKQDTRSDYGWVDGPVDRHCPGGRASAGQIGGCEVGQIHTAVSAASGCRGLSAVDNVRRKAL